MQVELHGQAITDYNFWQKSGNKAIQKKIQQLIIGIQRDPYLGIGKPELLKYNLSGQWSRRINEEHRIVYDVINNVLHIYSLRGHYK
ncbi:Txe/YoeB family addiction module toxin [Pedobacter endophyticus]|uniref:Putative mRNA interferase YoeB n=1 Tax=Pedobacter endophyticus TaxID=2789740 RepID=A0A7S9KZG3_9SPHI|nr:Txe/YoeB family addiction module toxin [Pedobacter endophyticus]QPH39707.1 Txe/YoeB family addiction module toxin [Pedobacter endophyticus]